MLSIEGDSHYRRKGVGNFFGVERRFFFLLTYVIAAGKEEMQLRSDGPLDLTVF